MVSVLGTEQLHRRAVELRPVQEAKVRITPSLAAASGEVGISECLVDPEQVAHHPVAAGDAVPDGAGRGIDQVEVSPPVPLRPPDDGFPTAQRTPVGDAAGILVCLDVGLAALLHDRACCSGARVGRHERELMVAPLADGEEELVASIRPAHILPEGVGGHPAARRVHCVDGRHIHSRSLGGRDIERVVVEGRNHRITGQRIPIAVQNRARVLRLQQVHLANVALVPLMGNQTLRVGRPEDVGAQLRLVADVRHLLAAADIRQSVAIVWRSIGCQRALRHAAAGA